MGPTVAPQEQWEEGRGERRQGTEPTRHKAPRPI